MDFPLSRMPAPPVLTTFHPDCLGFNLPGANVNLNSTALSATWPATNTAYFYPFRLKDWATAYQLLFYVGATSSGNIDVGIYDSQKNLIVSAGSTGMSATTNAVQELNITDTVLAPGDYLLAAGCDNTTATVFRAATNDELTLPVTAIYEQTGLSAGTLTNPGVPVVSTLASPARVAIGIQFRSIF